MSPFSQNCIVVRDNTPHRLVRAISEDVVQLERISDGLLSQHQVKELLDEFVNGTLLVPENEQPQGNRSNSRKKPARMDMLGKNAKNETMRRLDYLTRLNQLGAFHLSIPGLISAIADIARMRNEPNPPHITTIQRWRRQYLLNKDIRAIFSHIDSRGGKGKGRLSPEVEAMVDEAVTSTMAAQRVWCAEEIHNKVFLKVTQANTTRIESEWLSTPSLRTIQRRLSQIYAYDACVARFGEKEAERRFANIGRSRNVRRILELVEIDHTPLDILVVNDEGVVIGRPYATVVIDRFSRCVLGLHLSLAGHGTEAVFSALRHALMPKTYLSTKASFSDLELSWDCFGWPSTVLMDNGPEFHAESVVDTLLNLGIIGEYSKSRSPNDKPHVERFLRTLNYSFIHKMPGTTFAKVHQRVGFKSEEEACLTLEQLDQQIHVWICNVYHVRPHAGLDGRCPIAVWKNSAAACPPQLKMNVERVDLEMARLANSAVQHYGIDLNTHIYSCSKLSALRRVLPEKAKVSVKWSAIDVGHVWVWDPTTEDFFKVPNVDQDFNGLTLEQAAAVKKARAKGDPDYRLTRATAQSVNADLTAQAMQSKKLKDRRKSARQSNQTSNDHRQSSTSTSAPLPEAEDCQEQSAVDYQTIEVEIVEE